MRRFTRPLFAGSVVALAAFGTACSDNPTNREITAPNKALAGTTSGVAISNVKAASGTAYKVVSSGMTTGATLYVDRTYTAKSVSSSLTGASYIETANNDKTASAGSASFLSFDIGSNATVYVAHDDAIALPTWLKGWTKTTASLVSTDNAKHFTVYSHAFAAGHVTLGSNTDSGPGGSMYSVMVVGSGSTTTPDSTSTDPSAHDGWFVSPSGASGNDGSAAHPWSLSAALGGASGKIQPGDTVWLRGGTYKGAFTSSLTGTSSSPIIVRQFPGERATIDGHLTVTGGYTWYWGFEVTTSETAPGNVIGFNMGGPGVKAINIVSHDNGGNGFGVWEQAPDAEVYGSIVYNNGRQRVTSGYAHGIYTQNSTGSKLFQDDIVFHQFAYGFHAYAESGSLRNMTFVGNVSFNNGGGQPDFFIGGMTAPSNMTLTNNMSWHSNGGGSVWMGYDYCGCTGTNFTLRDNYFVGGGPVLRLQHLSGLTLSGNTLVGPGGTATMIQETGSSSGFSLSNNKFFGDGTSREYQWYSGTYTFPGWKSATGFGSTATYSSSKPTGVKVFVRPNKYEKGRANVIIYNWARQGAVSVDLSNVLSSGDRYEIRNVQDYYGTPVATGTYGGGSVSFPMTGVTSPTPKGGWVSTPPVTGPDFNVFVVLKK